MIITNNYNSPTIMVLRPERKGDPTEYTYQWAQEALKMMKSYDYTVIDIKKDEVTYDNVSNAIAYYKPRLIVSFSHGCPTSIQGQNECVITRRFDVDELVKMSNFKQIIEPLIMLSGCKNTCKSMPDVCNPICMNDTNVNLLKDTIVFTVACYSASQLGKCAIKYGADSYIGYSDLMLFPVDDIGSQDMFRDVHLTFLKEILNGNTVGEAEYKMSMHENSLIRMYKSTKYVSLPLLWNKLNRKVLGDKSSTLYSSHEHTM